MQTPDYYAEIETMQLSEFTEKAYLDYSMYVILDRALPNIGDGLKPVQRRIVYAMSELGLVATAKPKKSARTVGDVIGKFHPHGDSACYEAMVMMAQPFSYRYPLVNGQGNWGSPDDPKSFAAMRYTESKLSAYADILLAELAQGTVDWGENYDGTQKEPLLLPARLPNILLNGATGIAVGMATDIPPHNIHELVAACVYLLEYPKATVEALCDFILAPDFPTEAEIITPKEDIMNAYRTGYGSVHMRAVYMKEGGDIVITALPHHVSGDKIRAQIKQQIQAKKLPFVDDARDESDHENPTRIVIVPRSNRVNIEKLMSHLFATTDLEKSYRINFNMIGINGKPEVKNLVTILKEWLDYRIETVRRRLQFRLEKVLQRIHAIEGRLIAFLNIDEVITIIRQYDKPKVELMQRFSLSERQAEDILEIKLRQLAKLEEVKLQAELDVLQKEEQKLTLILSSERRLKTMIRKELLADAAEYGDPRRSPVVQRETAQAFSESSLLGNDPLTIILSKKGWIRSGKGHEVDVNHLSYKAGDDYLASVGCRSNENIFFIDSSGRGYTLPAHTFPSARGQGEPLTGRLTPPSGTTFQYMLNANAQSFTLLVSNYGIGFVVEINQFSTKNKAGKALFNLNQGATILTPLRIDALASDKVLLISNKGRCLLVNVRDLPILTKGKGNKIMGIPKYKVDSKEEWLVIAEILPLGHRAVLYSGKRKLTLNAEMLAQYEGERGKRGTVLAKGFQKIERVEIIT